MVRRKSVRLYAFADVEELEQGSTMAQQQSDSRSARANTVATTAVEGPTSARPMKRLKTATTCDGGSSPLQPSRLSSSNASAASLSGTATSSPREQPLVSLARLPLDILLRIGHFLLPLPIDRTIPSSSHPLVGEENAGAATRSPAWLDYGADLVRFSSTCRAAWAATRHLVGRSFGCDVREIGSLYGGGTAARWVKRRLRCIVADEVYDMAVQVASTRNGRSRELMPRRPIEPHEYIPASKIRHLYIAVDGNDTSVFNHWLAEREGFEIEDLTPLAEVLAAKLPLLTNLESVALVWKDERSVVSTAPYNLATVPADVLVALTAHPTLRDVLTCGIKWSRRFCDGTPIPELESDDPAAAAQFRFGPQMRSLTVNASHDSGLELATMAPGLKEVRAWRDFTRVPRTAPEFWWNEETWKTVERVDLTGFSSEQAWPLLRQMMQQLSLLRSLPTPPILPLHTLRLSEPYHSTTLYDVLPTLAHLPNLRTFTVFVWNDRFFGPSFLQRIVDVMPDLEELGVGLESEGLNWWQGSLVDYAAVLKQLRNLRNFTWNYTPYADLDYPETRKHVLPFLLRSFASPTYAPPSFSSIHWFNEPIYFRRLPQPPSSPSASTLPGGWKWSDDPVFERKLPRWAVEALRTEEEREGERKVEGWMDEWGSIGEEDEEEDEGATEEGDEEEETEEGEGSSSSGSGSPWTTTEADTSDLTHSEDVAPPQEEGPHRLSSRPSRRTSSSKGKVTAASTASASNASSSRLLRRSDAVDLPLPLDVDEQEQEKENVTLTYAQSLARASTSASAAVTKDPQQKKKGRKSIGELLMEAKREAVREGKRKAVVEPALAGKGGTEGAEDKLEEEEDSGFWEMEVADL